MENLCTRQKKEELLRDLPLYQDTFLCRSACPEGASYDLLCTYECVEIDLIVSGSGIHQIANQSIPCTVGDIYVLQPDVPHGFFVKDSGEAMEIRRLFFDPAGWFKNCYGIVRDKDVPVETIIIRAFGQEANYLRDLPFHHSQKEIAIEDGYSDFELTLSPTADFLTPLMSRGSAIKILQPQWLADEIKRLHLEAAKLYE